MKCSVSKLIFELLILKSSACFEPEDSSSEDGCIYSYGILSFTCITISSPVNSVEHTLLPTRLLLVMRMKRTTP